MEIVIIGTGKIATILGRKLKEGHHIVQVYGRNATTASELAYELATESTAYWTVVNRQADLVRSAGLHILLLRKSFGNLTIV